MRKWSKVKFPPKEPAGFFEFARCAPRKKDPRLEARRAADLHAAILAKIDPLRLLLLTLTEHEAEIIHHLYEDPNAKLDEFPWEGDVLRKKITRINGKFRDEDFHLQIACKGERLWLAPWNYRPVEINSSAQEKGGQNLSHDKGPDSC